MLSPAMNKRQKIVTGVAIVAMIIWGAMLNEDMGQPEKYRNPVGDFGALFVILAVYVALLFMLKSSKPPRL